MNNRKVINISHCNSYLHFLCWLKESLRQASKKELVHFFEREQTSPKVTEAKERALCGGGKKSFPSRRPAGGTTQSTMQANAEAKRAWTMLSCEEKKMRSILTYSIVFSPQPCYGRRIFSFTPHVAFSDLQPANATSDIFYYHTNHLGSTAFVTDNNAIITQGFLYAPFGEITTEYNANFGYNVLPKYSFNAKELDEETGMYYYEARYYKPPVFTSRDPMFEKYFWMTQYAYCANNPVKYVDPSGMILDIADNDETKKDLKSIVKKENRDRVVFDGIHVSVNTEGLSDKDLKKDIGLSLILDLCNSDKKFLFETSDFAFTLDEKGLPNAGTLNHCTTGTVGGIINASNYGKDDYGGHEDRPRKGYDGHVIVAKSGTWYSSQGKEIRASVVFHELAENYFRTHHNYNYYGVGWLIKKNSAHSEAVFREPKYYFNNCKPGKGSFKGFSLTPEQKASFLSQKKAYIGF